MLMRFKRIEVLVVEGEEETTDGIFMKLEYINYYTYKFAATYLSFQVISFTLYFCIGYVVTRNEILFVKVITIILDIFSLLFLIVGCIN